MVAKLLVRHLPVTPEQAQGVLRLSDLDRRDGVIAFIWSLCIRLTTRPECHAVAIISPIV